MATAAAVVAAVVAGSGAVPAGAVPGPGPLITVASSTATSVGFQIFAVANLIGGVHPTGTVTFRLFGPSDGLCLSAPLFTSTVAVTGSTVNSANYATTAIGNYRWEATYNGDANNSPSGPTLCLSPLAMVIVGQASSNINLTVSPLAGGTIRALAALYGYLPTGTVTFLLSPPGDAFCATTVFTSTVTVNGNATYTSAPFTPSVAGQYKWRASYSGDANNQGFPITSCLYTSSAVTVPPLTPPTANFTNPVDGEANLDTSVPLSWPTIPQAQGYFVVVGTTPGGSDLVWSGTLPGTQGSYKVAALPAGTLYAELYTEVNGVWYIAPVVRFTAIPNEAGLTAPTSGQANVAINSTFTWTTVSGVQGYALWIGTVYGAADLVNSGLLPSTQSSFTPPPLPAGQTLYVLMLTERNGTWSNQAITISTASG